MRSHSRIAQLTVTAATPNRDSPPFNRGQNFQSVTRNFFWGVGEPGASKYALNMRSNMEKGVGLTVDTGGFGGAGRSHRRPEPRK